MHKCAKMKQNLPIFKRKFTLALVLICTLSATQHLTEACTSRTVPKPRPSTTSTAAASSSISATPLPTRLPTTSTPATTTTVFTTTTTPRPNITFPTYKCPANYDAWYCLNDASCFSIKIGDSVMYNCECAIGFMGARCEFKELDGSYLPKRPRPVMEKASIANGATFALLFVMFLSLILYLRYDNQKVSKSLGLLDDEDKFLGHSSCRYCHDRRCCGGTSFNGGVASLSFAIKRTTKL